MAKKPVVKAAARVTDAPEADAPVTDAADADAIEVATIEPVPEVPAPPPVLMVQTASGNPPLHALNARSHDVNAGREVARREALAAAQKAVEDAFKKV